jgi:hypothetical protein
VLFALICSTESKRERKRERGWEKFEDIPVGVSPFFRLQNEQLQIPKHLGHFHSPLASAWKNV